MALDIANGIYWDKSWSPIIGCTHPGAGCANCWAARMAHRFASNNSLFAGLTEVGPRGARWNGGWKLNAGHLADPLTWTKPRYVGCNWMGDLFHPGVPDGVIALILSIMASSMDHTFFLLTKFPERLASLSIRLRWVCGIEPIRLQSNNKERAHLLTCIAYLKDDGKPSGGVNLELRGLPGNIWAGTSISQASEGDKVTALSDVICKHRWVSMEPLYHPIYMTDRATFAAPDVNWLVVGGENAAKPKPIPLDYCRFLRDKCADNGIPFFMKQLHGCTKAERQTIPEDLLIRQLPDTTRRRKDGLKEKTIV